MEKIPINWRALILAILVSGLVSGCRFTFTAPSPVLNVNNTNTNNNANNNDNDNRLNPPPCTTCPGNGSPPGPGNGSPGAPRVPDPPPGLSLPLPSYGESALLSYAAAHPELLAHSCQDTEGAIAWRFLDGFIDSLRVQDSRWGYVCNDGSACTNPSKDKVSYHATAGPDVAGARGIWIIDVIQAHCEAPKAQWQVIGFDPLGVWGTRGRF